MINPTVSSSSGIAGVVLAAASALAGASGLTLLDVAFGSPGRRQLLGTGDALSLALMALLFTVATLFNAYVLFRKAGLVA